MRIGILMTGVILIGIMCIALTLSPSQKQTTIQIIVGTCAAFFGPTGSLNSKMLFGGCQTYLESKMLFFSIGILLTLLGLLLPSKPKESKFIESRAGGRIWNELEHTSKPIDKEALKALKVRYAKGEITKQQYDQMRLDLEEDSPHHSLDKMPY